MNRVLSSIGPASFHGITPPFTWDECYPCRRSNLLPMSPVCTSAGADSRLLSWLGAEAPRIVLYERAEVLALGAGWRSAKLLSGRAAIVWDRAYQVTCVCPLLL